MSILNFQVGQKIRIDNKDYYVTNLEINGFYKKTEVTMVRMK